MFLAHTVSCWSEEKSEGCLSGLDTTGRSVGEKDAGWIAVVLYELIVRLYNFSALVPQSYVAQWVDLMSIAPWLCYDTYRLCYRDTCVNTFFFVPKVWNAIGSEVRMVLM